MGGVSRSPANLSNMLVREYVITFQPAIKDVYPTLHKSYFINQHISSSWEYTRKDMERHKKNVKKVEICTWMGKYIKVYKKISDPFIYKGEEYQYTNNYKD